MTTRYYKTVYEWQDDGTLAIVERSMPYEYDGPWAECKKGRESQAKITDADIARMNQQTAQQKVEQGAADKTIGTWETQGKPGQLSPAAAAQLAADQDNIARTYNTQRQQVARTIGARGFGSAPSGFASTAMNAANLGQNEADTGAFRNAQVNTQNLQQAAVNAREGLSGQNLQGAQGAATAGSDAAYKQSQMGSTLGDIAGGIAMMAPIIAAPFTGGATLIPGGFGKIGTPGGGGGGTSGVGGYGRCYVAAELYGGWDTSETHTLREFIFNTGWMRPFAAVYERIGERWANLIRTNRPARTMTKHLFDFFLRCAEER